MKRLYFIMTLVCILMVSCGKDPEKATVKINDVTEITTNSAKVICEVTDDGGADVTARGLCYGTSENITLANAQGVYGGKGVGVYECEIKDLDANTKYYVRAYAKNSVEMAYGEEMEFMTLGVDDNGGDEFAPDGNVNGYTYVDLGLPSRVKWATHNIGATSSAEPGDTFLWGSTTPYTLGEQCLTFGNVMSDFSGNPQYDAATASWGDSWRMPTKEELSELKKKCTWTWMAGGYKVTGPNGHSIFLPYGSKGMYWSSTPKSYENVASAYYLSILVNMVFITTDYRDLSMSIRPVTDR